MYAKLAILATVLVAAGSVAAEFSCIKPVNPIPAGPPGACCEELYESFLLDFLYTGKNCWFRRVVNEGFPARLVC
jgi:hypothetical protein